MESSHILELLNSNFQGSLLSFKENPNSAFGLLTFVAQITPNAHIEACSPVIFKPFYYEAIRITFLALGYDNVEFNNTGRIFWTIAKNK